MRVLEKAMIRSVGVIGLGIMGGAIARNLLDAGFKVFGCDPDAQAAERAKAKERRIRKLLPGATPVAVEFGANLALDQMALEAWRA